MFRISVIWAVFLTLLQSTWARREIGLLGIVIYPIRVFMYLSALVVFLLIFGSRGIIIVCLYAWSRRIDDKVDGDIAGLDCDYREYLRQRKQVIQILDSNPKYQPQIFEDVLVAYILTRTKLLNIALSKQLFLGLDLIEFDRARSNGSIFTRVALLNDMAQHEIVFLGMAAEILEGNPDTFYNLYIIREGILSRTDTLDDIFKDFSRGIVNIPQEAIKQFGVDITLLRLCLSREEMFKVPGFSCWYEQEVKQLAEAWVVAKFDLKKNADKALPSTLVRWLFLYDSVGRFEKTFNKIYKETFNTDYKSSMKYNSKMV